MEGVGPVGEGLCRVGVWGGVWGVGGWGRVVVWVEGCVGGVGGDAGQARWWVGGGVGGVGWGV